MRIVVIYQKYQELTLKYKYKSYFQLQSGSELLLDVVNCFWFVPVASMLQICKEPERFD